MKKRNLSVVLVMALFAIGAFGRQAAAQCIPGVPLPLLELTGIEHLTDQSGNNWTRFSISVVNWESFSDELFEPAPDLPPCGINTEASRTWVNIYNARDDSYIYGFCGLSANEPLADLWFITTKGQEPHSIKVEVYDRECNIGATSLPLRVFGPTADLVGLEVVQVIQDWENTVPLIPNKTTYVRAHVRLNDSEEVIVEGRLRGFRGATELEGSPLAAINEGTEENAGGTIIADGYPLDRGSWEKSLNFRLPDSWLNGTITLQFEAIDPEIECLEAAGTPNDCSVDAVFHLEAPSPKIYLVSIEWIDDTGVTHAPEPADLDEIAARLLAIYPLADIDWSSFSMSYPQIPQSSRDLANINDRLLYYKSTTCMQLSQDPFAAPNCDALYYGMVVTEDNIGGLANDIPGAVASGGHQLAAPFAYGRNKAAHELAHVLGVHHAVSEAEFGTVILNGPDGQTLAKIGACGERAEMTAPEFPFIYEVNNSRRPTLGPMDAGDDSLIYGLDTHQMRPVDPEQTFDLMGYCGSNQTRWKWISSFTYENVMNALEGRAPQIRRFTPERELTVVRITTNRTLQTAQFLPVSRIVTGVSVDPVPQGDYLLELRNNEGIVVQSISFQPIEYHPDFPAEDTGLGSAIISVLSNPEITQASVARNGDVLASIFASANPPSVQVIYPNGGESLSGEYVTAQWIGSDPDGDELTYVLQYSTDAGITWDTLGIDLTETQYEIELQLLHGTENALIRVMASDGFNTAQDDSDDVFSVPNNPPMLFMVSPSNDDIYSGTQQVFFEARAIDREDGHLPGSSIEWISLVGGPLGTGEVINMQATSLSEGEHAIMVTATDTAGLTDSKIANIRVFRGVPDLTPPLINAGSDITVECQGAETVVALPTPVVSDSVDPTPIITNDAPAAFPPGCTTVTFSATDAAGNSATDSIDVCVVDTTPPDLTVTIEPSVLWPPNHKMVEVMPSVQASDICCYSDLSVALVSARMDEGDTQSTFDPAYDLDPTAGYLGEDIQMVDGRIYLRAERAGDSNGRVYTITYQATDCAGNISTATAFVTVPHDMD